MTPTSTLRFVERGVPVPEHGENVYKTVRILQQWWTHTGTLPEFQHEWGEWRDIPVEKEQ